MNTSISLELTTLEKCGEKLFALRDYTPIPIGIIAIAYAQPTELSLALGLIIAFLGEFFRLYGVAFIGSISRTRSYSNGSLVSSGPFSLLRNPLYFGNLGLTLGFAFMSGIVWIVPITIIFFYAQYIPIVAWEEKKLLKIFGQEYTQYCTKVPNRWFPLMSVFLQYNWIIRPESWIPALKSEKRTFTAIIVVVLSLFTLFWINIHASTPILPLANFLFSGK